MNQLVIHLEEYFLEKVLVERIRTNETTAPEAISICFDYDYEIKRNPNDPYEFVLTFIVRDDPKIKTENPQVYKLDLQIIGLFRFDEGTDEKQMQYLIRYNGCTILYGILRGMLATITGTFPEGAIRMPTIMVDEIVNKVEAENKATAPKKKAAKKVAKKRATKSQK